METSNSSLIIIDKMMEERIREKREEIEIFLTPRICKTIRATRFGQQDDAIV